MLLWLLIYVIRTFVFAVLSVYVKSTFILAETLVVTIMSGLDPLEHFKSWLANIGQGIFYTLGSV